MGFGKIFRTLNLVSNCLQRSVCKGGISRLQKLSIAKKELNVTRDCEKMYLIVELSVILL